MITALHRTPGRLGPCRSLVCWLLIVCVSGGCSAASWQRYQESPANPAVWIRALVPPKGETFYSDKAQQIDHHLGRD